MRRSRKFGQRGSNSATLATFFYFFFRGERIQIALKAGHHRPARETPFTFFLRADDGPTLNTGLVALRILIIAGHPVQYC